MMIVSAQMSYASAATNPAASSSASPGAKLEQLKSDIESSEARAQALEQKAEASRLELAKLQTDLIKLAGEAKSREAEIAALSLEIEGLEDKRRIEREGLATRLDQLMQSLAALERIERRPPAALLARPGEAIDRARSAALLSALVPRLSADAEELKRRMAAIEKVESALIARRTALEAARTELSRTRSGIDAALAKRAVEKRNLEAQLGTERERLEKFAREAKDLEGLIAKIEADNRARKLRTADEDAPPPPKLSAEALAAVTGRLPASGKIIRAFGQADAGGLRADGITVQAARGAQVTTPVKGRVAFSGPFKGFGQLLIVAAPGGYHVLLAGLSRLYADPGQDLKGGEPVGELGEDGLGARLYLEVRLHGKPIDPIPYLAAHDGKVSG
jgi:septal ring factor EnvC (AmiA/AmiB activator)